MTRFRCLALTVALLVLPSRPGLPVLAVEAATSPAMIPFSTGPHPPARGLEDPAHEAPLVSSTDAEELDGSYIVVLKDSVPPESHDAHHEWLRSFVPDFSERGRLAREQVLASIAWNGMPDSHIRHVYTKAFRGYAGKFDSDVLARIRRSPEVAYVERDQTVYINDLQRNAPWGLSRISHHAIGFGTFNKYPYDNRAGGNVTVYVVDTGINIDHLDFEGRARWGATIPLGDEDKDGNGHGSHCAGTIAGRRYGVAKKADVVAVKVLRSNGSGTMSDVIKGVEYVGEKHSEEMRLAKSRNERGRATVANMSLGGGRSRTLDRVVDAVVDAGVHFAVAAGNDNRDACDYSPAAAKKAVTVGASTITDERAYFSNYGKCVDIFAPGKDITSTWIGSKVATNTISGTSMASPHIAGLLAYKLSLYGESEELPTPKELKSLLIKTCTMDTLSGVPEDTPNCLAFSDPPGDRSW